MHDRLQLLSLAVEQVGEGIAVCDLDGNLLYANKVFAEMHGYEPDELPGKHLSIFHSREQMPAVKKANRDMKKTGQFEGDVWHTRRDGAPFLANMCNTLLCNADCEPIGMIRTMRDVSELRRTEKKLRVLSSRNEALLASIPDIIMEVNSEKIYTWVNRAGLEFFGEDVLGKEAAHYFEGEQDTYEFVQPIFNGDENVIYVESWQHRRDGEVLLLAWWCKILKDADGKATGALSTARDITEHKRSVEELQNTAKELKLKQGELIDKNIALTEILDQIEQQRKVYRHRICLEIEQLCLPVLQQAKLEAPPAFAKALDRLEERVKTILNQDIDVFRERYSKLTPRELDICSLIRRGKNSKEISTKLNLALVTIHTHRQQIRRKLDLSNKSINLSTFLRIG